MIVGTMQHGEIADLFFKDWLTITSGNTINRLGLDYDKERKKLKIKPTRTYTKCYEIKTNSKNKWLLFFSKAPSVTKYKDTGSVNYVGAVYYDTPSGIEVIKESVGFGVSIYKPDFFREYEAQMDLPPAQPINLIKAYFISNGYSVGNTIAKSDDCVIFVSRDGFILGYLENKSADNKYILVNLSLLNRKKVSSRTAKLESRLINGLQIDIEKILSNDDWVKKDFDLHADIMKGIID